MYLKKDYPFLEVIAIPYAYIFQYDHRIHLVKAVSKKFQLSSVSQYHFCTEGIPQPYRDLREIPRKFLCIHTHFLPATPRPPCPAPPLIPRI